MRKLLFLLLLLLPGMSFCQKDKVLNTEETDSIISSFTKRADSLTRTRQYYDSIEMQRSISSNVNGILRIQQENRERQKKAAIRRIAFGGAMLVILIIGLMRRRRKK